MKNYAFPNQKEKSKNTNEKYFSHYKETKRVKNNSFHKHMGILDGFSSISFQMNWKLCSFPYDFPSRTSRSCAM